MFSDINPSADEIITTKSKMIDVSIIIPLLNKLELTKQCLESINRHLPKINHEIIFIDNGSTDDTRLFLKELKGNIKSIINEKNIGFAKACNQGVKAAIGKYFLFLNNDIVVTNNWLKPLVDILNDDPNVGAVGSKLLFPDMKIQHAGVIIIDDRKLPDPLVGRHIYYKQESTLIEANSTRTYQALTAACLLVRKTAFDKAGGFDEGFWNGYEDVDLCFKLQEHNWTLVYEPNSVLIHYESQSGPERFKQIHQNIKRLHQKWIGKIIPDLIIEKDGSFKTTSAGKIAPYAAVIPGIENTLQTHDGINKNRPIVSIIILTHNQLDYTKRCLESIFKHTHAPFELILVDNGSTDNTVTFMESLVTGRKDEAIIKIIRNQKNLGFAAGNNQGIVAALGNYILLLNNDTIVTKGWLEHLIACAEAHPKAGIIGPMSNNVSGPQLIKNVNYNTQTAGGLNKFARRFADNRKGRAQQVLRVVGFCMLIKREVVNKIGGLDEGFGKGNFEDDDFSLRAALAGFESWVSEDSFVHHFGSRTFAGAKIDYRTSLLNNWQIFKEKWGLPRDLPYGSGYNIFQLNSTVFNPQKHYIHLPGSTSGNEQGQNENAEPPKNASVLDDHVYSMLDQARALAHRGKADKAVSALLKEIKTCRDHKMIYFSLIEILINERKYHDALEIIAKIPADTDEIKSLEFTGCCKEALGLDGEAEEYARAMLALDKDCTMALFLKGKLAFKKGMPKEAEMCFSQAVKSDKTFGPAYSWLGLLKSNEGLVNESLDLLEKGFVLSPTNNEPLTNYHKEAMRQMAFERAERTFRDALARHPYHRMIHFQVIDILIRQEKFEAAMGEIEKAILEYGVDHGLVNAALSIRKKLGPKEIKESAVKERTVSLCMIVKNEENNIVKCLINLKPLADEMIIVDTGSTDRTKALAEIYGAKVYDFEWADDFSAARNFSISKAKGGWILVMDADEAISSDDFASLGKILKSNKQTARAYIFTTRNYHTRTNIIGLTPNDGKYMEETGLGWVPSDKVRLFKNGLGIRFEYPVHEAVEPFLKRNKIPVQKCHTPIHHYGKLNYSKDLKKGEAYYYLGLEKLERSPDNVKAIFELAIQAGGLQKWEEAIGLWQRYNTLSPGNPHAYANMGTSYLSLRRFDEAIDITKKAMELAPHMADAFSNYALCHILKGEAEAAVPVLERLEQENPDYYSGRFKLAIAYACTGMQEKSLTLFNELKKTPIGPILLNGCRDMVKELVSFGQSRYAKDIVRVTELLLTAGNHNPPTERCAC